MASHGKALSSTGPTPAVAAEVRSAPREVLTPVGDQLRAERERRGVTLAEVVKATKIRESYLEALEQQDWDALPASVFARGYLRTYAGHLGLDAEHVLKVYDRQRRLDSAADPSATDSDENDARAILEQIARARGIDTRPLGRRWIWNGLALAGMAVATVAVWMLVVRPATGLADGPVAAAGTSSPAAAAIGAARVTRVGGTALPPADATARAQPRQREALADPTDLTASTSRRDPIPSQSTPTPVPQRDMPAQTPKPSHLTVRGFGIGADGADPTLTPGPNWFEEGSVLWFRASVQGGRPGDTIRHVWRHEGRPFAVAPIDLDGETSSTESHLLLPPGSIGEWTVEVRDPAGRVLARSTFTCVATADPAEDL